MHNLEDITSLNSSSKLSDIFLVTFFCHWHLALVTMSSHCPCGFISSTRGMGNHRHSCRTYKDVLKCSSGSIAPRGPLDRNCFMRAPAQVVTQPVQEQSGPSHCIEAEEPLAHLTNATDDIQMVHTTFFSFYEN